MQGAEKLLVVGGWNGCRAWAVGMGRRGKGMGWL